MAVLSEPPTEKDKELARGVLNYYTDQYGRTIVRKWRRKSGKYRKDKK